MNQKDEQPVTDSVTQREYTAKQRELQANFVAARRAFRQARFEYDLFYLTCDGTPVDEAHKTLQAVEEEYTAEACRMADLLIAFDMRGDMEQFDAVSEQLGKAQQREHNVRNVRRVFDMLVTETAARRREEQEEPEHG